MTMDRKELYDLSWATPASQLCRRFGISDVGLAKICKRHCIPRPPRGYWAKLRNGKVARRIPLPPPPERQPPRIEIHPSPTKEKRQLSPSAERRIAAEKAAGAPIIVGSRINAPHPLVALTRNGLGASKPDYQWGLLRPAGKGCLDVAVGPDSLDRSMRISNSLLKALEARGYRVRIAQDAHRQNTVVEIDGEIVPFRLTERVRKKPPTPKADPFRRLRGNEPLHSPTGDLRLQILSEWGTYATRTWQDKARQPIENQLNEFVVGLVERALELKAGREQARLARIEEERRRRAREDEERLRREEEERVRWVEATLDSWGRWQSLTRMIQDARTRATDLGVRITPESRLGRWIEAAERRAARLDALAPMLAELHLEESRPN